MITDALDWAMDRSVVPGFSSIGWRLRGLEGSSPDPEGNLRGRDVVVTGANSGIGFAACEAMAGLGARVHMVVRDRGRGEDARAAIAERTGSDDVHLHLCDVSSLDSVRALAADLDAELDGIDVLVHNAGVMTKERRTSQDGYELTLATHVLGPLLLTELLTPLLEARAPSRVIFVTSGGMYTERLDAEDLELLRREFDGAAFYAHAKRIQVILTSQLDASLGGRGIHVHAMHPGWVGHPRRGRFAPEVPLAHEASPAHSGPGRRHDRLARGGRRVADARRPPLDGPSPAPRPPGPMDARERRRADPSLDPAPRDGGTRDDGSGGQQRLSNLRPDRGRLRPPLPPKGVGRPRSGRGLRLRNRPPMPPM